MKRGANRQFPPPAPFGQKNSKLNPYICGDIHGKYEEICGKFEEMCEKYEELCRRHVGMCWNYA